MIKEDPNIALNYINYLSLLFRIKQGIKKRKSLLQEIKEREKNGLRDPS